MIVLLSDMKNAFKARANVSVLTSGKEEKVVIPSTLIVAVRWGKLRIYTMFNPPEVIFKLPKCDN